MVDMDYDGFSVRDLADSSLQTWVHHSPAILPQVYMYRTTRIARKGFSESVFIFVIAARIHTCG